jgi:hypothetical protein
MVLDRADDRLHLVRQLQCSTYLKDLRKAEYVMRHHSIEASMESKGEQCRHYNSTLYEIIQGFRLKPYNPFQSFPSLIIIPLPKESEREREDSQDLLP